MMMMMMMTMMMAQVCRDNFEKSCQISFRPEVSRETVTNESRASGHVTQYSPPIGQVRRESVRVCSRPLLRTCNGQGPEVCTVQYETTCTTRYSGHQGLEQLILSTCYSYLCSRQVEASPGKKVAETKCEQLPVNICGAGCFTQEAEQEECEDEEVITSVN